MGVLWVGAEPGGNDGHLFFGLWRTRVVALALGLVGLAVALACTWVSRRALFTFVATSLLGLVTGMVLDLAGQLGLVSYAVLLGNRGELPTHAVAAESLLASLASGPTARPDPPRAPPHPRPDRRSPRSGPTRRGTIGSPAPQGESRSG